jgi:hypothetical protein
MEGGIFTQEELKELGTKTVDLVVAAIDAGDKEKAKKLSGSLQREFLSMHDLYVDWVASLLTFIYRKYGDAALYDALKETYGEVVKQTISIYAKEKDMRRKVQLFARGLKGHLESVKIEEDDEKFTFVVDPCGSGGRLARRGGYEPPTNLAKVKRAQHMTLGRKDFPIYCCHAPFQEMAAIEMTGKPWIIEDPPQNIGKEPCRIYMYKDTEEVPEKWYRRIGKKKGKVKQANK